MKIYYVGLKHGTEHGETAFSELTGIVWRQKDEVHEIDDRVASRMLQHPDVFSNKSPAERAALEAEQKAILEAQRAQVEQQQASGGLQALLAALPAGTKITLPDGTGVEIPRAALDAQASDPRREAKAARLGNFTDPDNGDSNKADFGAGDTTDKVQETKVAPVDTSGVTLAPGGKVAAAPAPAPAPAPAATASDKPAAAAGTTKAKRG